MSFKIPSADEFIKKLNELDDNTFNSIYKHLVYEIDQNEVNQALQDVTNNILSNQTSFTNNASKKIESPIKVSKIHGFVKTDEYLSVPLKSKKIDIKYLTNEKSISSKEVA